MPELDAESVFALVSFAVLMVAWLLAPTSLKKLPTAA